MAVSADPPGSLAIAVIGASSHRRKFGNKSVRAHAAAGYRVYPIHPSESSIEGWVAYPSLTRLPPLQHLRVSVYVPPSVLLGMLPDIAACHPHEVWLNPGTSSSEVLLAARELGLPIIEGCSIVDLGLSPSQFPD
jgi:predicted CoA-binding protein